MPEARSRRRSRRSATSSCRDFADFCMIDLFDEDGEVTRAGLRVSPGGGEGSEARPCRAPPVDSRPDDRGRRRGLAETPLLRADDRPRPRRPRRRARGPRVPEEPGVPVGDHRRPQRPRADHRRADPRPWPGRAAATREEDAHFAWILSGRVALALDNCGLFADLERAERARAEIAETLQRGLLPPPLPHIPGWSVAAMYRPAGSENEVGGDFYDVFRVADGWMLVIGDVTGRGARAASLTAVARYTLRTAATLTEDPVLALETLNRALFARGDSIAVQRRRRSPSARTPHEPVQARRRGPSAAAADRRRGGRGGQRRRPRPRRLCRCPLDRFPLRPRARTAAGRRHRRGHRGTGSGRALRRGAAAVGAGGRHRSELRSCSGSKARCTPSPGAPSTTTSRCSSLAPREPTAP